MSQEYAWQKECVTENITKLSHSTECSKDLFDCLVNKKILIKTEVDKIMAEKTPYEQASKLYFILPTKIGGLRVMVEALAESNQKIAWDILLKGLKKHAPSNVLKKLEEKSKLLEHDSEIEIPKFSGSVPQESSFKEKDSVSTKKEDTTEKTIEKLDEDPEIKILFSDAVYKYIFEGKPLEMRFAESNQTEADDEDDLIILPKKARGWACILNLVEFDRLAPQMFRESSMSDVVNLKSLWENLDYAVFPFYKSELEGRRKTKEDILKLITDFKNKCKVDKPPSIVLYIGSHGGYEDGRRSFLRTSNAEKLYVEDIIKEFHRSNCPSELKDIPKIILIQGCQKRRIENEPDDDASNPEDHNILVFESTSPGQGAFRIPGKGSWFVNCFISVMQENGKNKSIQEIMEDTTDLVIKLRDNKLLEEMQEPSISKDTIKKPLYFNL